MKRIKTGVIAASVMAILSGCSTTHTPEVQDAIDEICTLYQKKILVNDESFHNLKWMKQTLYNVKKQKLNLG